MFDFVSFARSYHQLVSRPLAEACGVKVQFINDPAADTPTTCVLRYGPVTIGEAVEMMELGLEDGEELAP